METDRAAMSRVTILAMVFIVQTFPAPLYASIRLIHGTGGDARHHTPDAFTSQAGVAMRG